MTSRSLTLSNTAQLSSVPSLSFSALILSPCRVRSLARLPGCLACLPYLFMQKHFKMAGLYTREPSTAPTIPWLFSFGRICILFSCTSLLVRPLLVLLVVLLAVCDTAMAAEAGSTPDTNSVCVLKGRIYTSRLWYGYLIDKAFHRDYAKIQYQISYPVRECCTNLLIYYDDQIKQLAQDMTCEDRERILPANNNQIIPLHIHNRTVGCSVWNETGEPYYVCVGERIFRSSGPRTWYFALSRCQANTPLTLNYAFNVSGYYGECEDDPLVKTYIPPSPKDDSNKYVSLALGVVAGVAVIAAVVFFALWFIARRRAANSKGSSVTSSQATMTQDDIFYVNPSLSDREQADYNSQASSENYYEVIPERRSYESINPHLLAAGPGGVGGSNHHPLAHQHPLNHLHPVHAHGAHARQLHFHPGPHAHATHVKDSAFHRPHPMGYVFDDYPPPPYQPPRMMGAPRHHTLHHPTPQHHHTLSLPMASRPRAPILAPTHAATLSYPVVPPPAPAPVLINNAMSINNGNNNGALTTTTTATTTTNTVSLQGETSA